MGRGCRGGQFYSSLSRKALPLVARTAVYSDAYPKIGNNRVRRTSENPLSNKPGGEVQKLVYSRETTTVAGAEEAAGLRSPGCLLFR
ncbi:hypothetical protein E2C01_012243 [Portunus trituberculatus]|uniref:Uncharacterized protein n=1 Tax=Portunus trituberculatus TaxID=210409 RepID=A0A5B7DDB3_PORTR|nr:hypothetical protein [Portunus trituberculatus]